MVASLIEKVKTLGIHLYVEDGKLLYASKHGNISAELAKEVKQHKSALIELLTGLEEGFTEYKQSSLLDEKKQELSPLSCTQQRLWFIDKLAKGSTQYNIPLTFTIKGHLQQQAFQKSVRLTVERHEILRTSIIEVAGEPQQKILPFAEEIFENIDLSTTEQSLKDPALKSIIDTESKHIFQLDLGSLIRIKLIKLKDDEFVVALTMHHIITDAWSMGLLMKELVDTYQALISDNNYLPEKLAVQYRQFSTWQNREINSANFKQSLEKYLASLKNLPESHGLLLNKERPENLTFEGSSFISSIGKEKLERINDICQENNVTLYMFLYTVYALLLTRYSDTDEVTIGCPIAGRNHSELESMIGFFANTLILPAKIDEKGPFSDLLAQQKKMILNAYKNQDIPFDLIIEKLNPVRDMSRSPLVQIMFVLQNQASNNVDLKDLQVEVKNTDLDSVKSELALVAYETESEIQLHWSYNTNLFVKEFVKKLSDGFMTILDYIIENPTVDILQIPHISAQQEKTILNDFCHNNLNLDKPESTVIDSFESIVNKQADDTALVIADKKYSYKDINQKANRLAHYLMKNGVSQGDAVAVVLEQGLENTIAILAIFKVNAVYVPIDSKLPLARKKYIINDSNVKLMIIESQLQDTLQTIECKNLCIDSEECNQELLPFSSDNPTKISISESADNTAYIIYTSGTSGLPKGVQVTQQAISSHIISINDVYEITKNDAVAQFLSIGFDVSIEQLLLTLTNGASAIVIDLDEQQYSSFWQQVELKHISAIAISASYLSALFNENKSQSIINDSCLRLIASGGEALSKTDLKFWLDNINNCRLVNVYGPTEAVVTSTYKVIDNQTDNNNIGSWTSDKYGYVLDSNQRLVATGAPGELYIGGNSIACAYINEEKLSKEKFILDPYIENRMIYRTGDKVYWDQYGNLNFLGRVDRQTNIRGHRVEVSEIEKVALLHSNIEQAVVTSFNNATGAQSLVAYFVLENAADSEQQKKAIQQHLSSFLPGYMLPEVIIFIDEIPLTINGKIDYKALSQPILNAVENKDIVEAQSELEKCLYTIWKNILNVEVLGIDCNFFELGGHSLLITQIIAKINEELNIQLPVRMIFDYPNIRVLASEISLIKQSNKAHSAIEKIERSENLPLSYEQQRIWFVDQLEGGSSQYNITGAFPVNGTLDHKAFWQALNKIVQRHEVLRTNFKEINGTVSQLISETVALPENEIDLGDLSSDEAENEIAKRLSDESDYSFDLSADQLLKVDLYLLGKEKYAVIFKMHHIIADGWSKAILVKELGEWYDHFATDTPSQLAPLSIQYADYAYWQKELLNTGEMHQQLDYWKMQLANIPQVHSLPLDHARPAYQSFNGDMYHQKLDKNIVKSCQKFCHENNISLFIFLETVFALLLGRYSNDDDIVIGTSVSGRNQQQIEPLIGFFVNTLVLRTQLDSTVTFRELLQANRETILNAYEHQEVPFSLLVEELKPERSLSHNPVVQILISFNNNEQNDLSLADLEIGSYDKEHYGSQFDLELNINEQDNELYLGWQFNTALFDKATIQLMALSFEVLINSALTDEHKSIGQINILPEAERYKLLDQWSGKRASFLQKDKIKYIHQLFEQQVEKTADSIAVKDNHQQLSYLQLNSQANKLAHYLQAMDIGKGKYIAICLHRSCEAMIAMLASMKVGATYIPLDPLLPFERLQAILSEAQPAIVLTTNELMAELPFEGLLSFPLDEEMREMFLANADENNISDVVFEQDDLAYIIYTSGTTGTPNGVTVPHIGVADYCLSALDHYYEKNLNGSVVVTNLCFDATVPALYLPLLAGGYVNFHSEHRGLDVYWQHILNTEQAYLLRLTPTHIKSLPMLCEEDIQTTAKHVFVVGGEALNSKELFSLRKYFPKATILNHYGPTEGIVGCTTFDTNNFDPATYITIPIGKRFGSTELYVLDKYLQPVPTGVMGELYIGRISLAKGYLYQPQLTENKFIDNPFNSSHCRKLYKTGDKVRWLKDGNLEYVERIDSQVKVRGFRIELGEIEAELSANETVYDAVVRVVNNNDNAEIVAYIVASHEMEADSDLELEEMKQRIIKTIQQDLKKSLPNYMIPTVFVLLKEMPVSRNGKIDRNALPAPTENDWQRADYVAPAGQRQKHMCDIWQEVLQLERVGINDNFFSLGGHSLLATKMMSLIRQQLNIEVPIRTLFEFPIVIEFIDAIEDHSDALVLADITKNTGATSLSYAQKRLWFIDKLEGGSAQYNIPTSIKVSGKLDINAFKQAVYTIVERHQILRTSYHEDDKQQVVSKIKRHFEAPVSIIDLTDMTESDKSRQLRQTIADDANQSFDLSHDLMLRVKLIQLNADEQVIMFIVHHIASDGWSSEIVTREFSQLYDAYSTGKPNPLKEMELQYADFAIWQQQWMQGEVLDQQINHWKNKLSDLPALHSLPLDRPRPKVQSYQGDLVSLQLDEKLSKQLQQLCLDCDVTLFMLLQTTFALLLSRFSNEKDIVMGTPISGRVHKDIEPLVGYFANTLILRNDCSAAESFRQLLLNNKEEILTAYEYQNIPFELLVEKLQPQRSLSHNPLFQILFVLQNQQQAELSIAELEVSALDLQSSKRLVKFDLELNINEASNGIICNWIYNDALFERESIEIFANSYQYLLSSILTNIDKDINAISLNDTQQQKQLSSWNATAEDFNENRCIHQIIEQSAADNAQKTAVSSDSGSLNYKQLNKQANQLAHYLLEQGLQLEDLVVISMDRSVEMVIAIMAVLKAGAAYVPIAVDLPEQRRKYILTDTAARFVLTHSRFADKFTETGLSIVELDKTEVQTQLAEKPALNPLIIGLSKNSLAYIIYTSGSTGVPKGVAVEHQALVNRLCWMQKEYQLTADDKVMQKTPFGFDVSVWEFLWTLSQGAELCMLAPEGHKDPYLLFDAIRNKGITTLHFVPSMLKNLLETAGWPADTCVRQVFCSGEALNKELVNQFYNTERIAKLYNLYGPTEAAIDVSYWDCSEYQDYKQIPIGRPISNIDLQIVNQALQLQPIGAIGELLIGGVGLARGYYNNKSLTEQVFIEDVPFTDVSTRYYKTGDLARWNRHGVLEYIGRTDDQVKLRGFRIELSEIKEIALQFPTVVDAVSLLKSINGIDHLLLYYVVTDTSTVDEQQLSQQLKSHIANYLPEYMVPEYMMLLPAIAMTANGKLDYKLLPDMTTVLNHEDKYLAPVNDVQITLCKIWQELLQLDEVGINHDFFLLGGHSLLATSMLSSVREYFKQEISLRNFFENPTIAFLAQQINSDCEKNSEMPDIVALHESKDIPLSFAQQRLWFVNQLDQDDIQHHIPGAYIIHERLQVSAVTAAIQKISQRHEILRTQFETSDNETGQAVQVILDEVDIPVDYIDLKELDESSQTTEIRYIIESSNKRAFDLQKAPLMRVKIISLSEDKNAIVFTLHHIIADGWSLTVLINEFVLLYKQIITKEQKTLEPLSVQYSDYALWQREWLQGETMERQLGYWQQRLQDIPKLHDLPLDFARPTQQSFAGAGHRLQINTSLTDEIKEFCQQNHVTLFMFLQTSFALLLSRYSNEEDIVIGSPIAGRVQKNIESLIGCFLNTLVLRTKIEEQIEFSQLLNDAKHNILDAYEHQHIPFEMLVERLQPDRSLSHNAIYQIVFAVQNMEQSEASLSDSQIEMISNEKYSVDYDLGLHITENKQGLGFNWSYCTALFKPETIERLAASFTVLLESILLDKHCKVNELSVIDKAQKHILIDKWSKGATVEYDKRPWITIFEQRVNKFADNIAVSYQQQSISYTELNQKANQVAHFLSNQGVTNSSVIALCSEPCIEMYAAILAILKTGAQYLPIDPQYPADRIEYVLQDSAAQFILTQSHLMSELPLFDIQSLPIDDDMADMLYGNLSTDNLDNTTQKPDATAYIIYTSGSTGQPKGVMIPQRGLSNLAQAQSEDFVIQASSRVLQFASMSFDAAISEWSTTLCSGATMVLIATEQRLEQQYFSELLESQAVTHLTLPPAFVNSHSNYINKSVQTLVLAGEFLSIDGLKIAVKHYPKANIINAYGATENSVCSSLYLLPDVDTETDIIGLTNGVAIGKPLANTQCYVLNSAFQPCPVGVVGELVVAGLGLANGYLNKQELSAQKFIQLPDALANIRAYRTGDLVKWLPTGVLEFVGRTDNQVKVRGYRIELSEIEQQLIQLPYVEKSAVNIIELENSQKIVAYLLLEEQQRDNFDSAEEKTRFFNKYKESLKLKLPEYMVPDIFMSIEDIPLTVNGKIDYAALPKPSENDLSKSAYIAPETKHEEILCGIWQQVLKIERIGVEDNLFTVGGDSIQAIQIVSRAKTHGLVFTVKDLFRYQTISALMPFITVSQQQSINQQAVAGEQQLLPIQTAFLNSDWQQKQHYNQSVLLKAPDDLNEETLREMIKAVVTRHDALRLTIQQSKGQTIAQYQNQNESMINNIVDCHELTEQGTDYQQSLTAMCQQIQSSFDLELGPLMKAVIFKLANGEQRLLLVAHHLVVDGVSWRILLADFEQAYQQLKSGDEINLSAKTSSMQEWASKLINYAQSHLIVKERQYWIDMLEKLSTENNLTQNRSTNTRENLQTIDIDFQLDKLSTEKLLTNCGSAYGTQINELLLASLFCAQIKVTGKQVLELEMEGHGREELFSDIDLSQTVGWFTSVYPVCISCESDNFGELIKTVKEQYRQMPNNGIGYSILKELTADKVIVDLSQRISAERINFNYLGQFNQTAANDTEFPIAVESRGKSNAIQPATVGLSLSGLVAEQIMQFRLSGTVVESDYKQTLALMEQFKQSLLSCIFHCESFIQERDLIASGSDEVGGVTYEL